MIEYALSWLPYEKVTVRTPQGFEYEGKRSLVKRICGVSILRAGETMEAALTEVCQNIKVGKILIQTSKDSGEPELYYLRLPKEIKDYQVILMDATVATGAAAMMAIRYESSQYSLVITHHFISLLVPISLDKTAEPF